ncbi:myelin-oligodendrocyte glycoprotein-like isoform X2 [Coturnix japonica]|uniref:myelin-oligodendrocyte glycoprotein-like isoform X2 n=1 Tax=Coturnix japonica TaxID=93934 RepID=UPI0007775EF8|nr:myelin-oligodendrocyte glycoprotein-like isoform X2 [Coturnix japonica]
MGFTLGCRHSSFSHHWRALLAHLVALHLLHLGSAQMRVVAPNLHVTAIVGQDVVLCCQLSPCKDAWSSEIRWIQHRSAGLLHHYRNGLDLEQMEEYKGRTELLRDGLTNGNLDLRITAVSSADSGSYICAVEDGDGYADAVVELEVSDPFSQIVHPWKVALGLVVTLLVGSFLIIAFLLRKQVVQSKELKEKDAALVVIWPFSRIMRFGVWLLEQVWDQKLFPLTMHFFCFHFAERKDAMLVEQAEKLEKKDAMLVELSRMSKSSDAKLDTLAAKLVEITNKFDKWNFDPKMQNRPTNLRAPMLKNQVAEQAERTEASEEPSRRRLRDETCHAAWTAVHFHRPQFAQDNKATISPSKRTAGPKGASVCIEGEPCSSVRQSCPREHRDEDVGPPTQIQLKVRNQRKEEYRRKAESLDKIWIRREIT